MKILLTGQVLVDRHEDVEFLRRAIKQLAIPHPGPAMADDGRDVMTGDQTGQPPRHTLIKEDAHLGASDNCRLSVAQDPQGLLARHARKVAQESLERFASLEVIEESLDWDAGATKHGRPAHDVRRPVNFPRVEAPFHEDHHTRASALVRRSPGARGS